MAACYLAVCFIAAIFPVEIAVTVIIIFVVQFFFGCGFSCLSNILHQNYGMRQLATVHGLMLSAWAAAGLFGNQLAAYIMRSYNLSVLYLVLGSLFVIEMVILIVWAKFISHPVWETKEAAICADCGCECKGFPQFRCEYCKDIKLLQVKEKVKAGN